MSLTTLQPLAYAVAYVTFIFGTTSIFLRLYCRIFILKTWGWDDWVAILIMVCFDSSFLTDLNPLADAESRFSTSFNKSCYTCSCIGAVDCKCASPTLTVLAHPSSRHFWVLKSFQQLEIIKVSFIVTYF